MSRSISRRTFLKTSAAAAAAGLAHAAPVQAAPRSFDISIAAWSFHRSIGTGEGKIPMLDLPKIARQDFDIGGVELVNRMMASTDKAYVDEFAKNCADNNVKPLLIMVDGEGNIGSKDESQREDAVTRHMKLVDIAADLGCHSIRMNWAGAAQNVTESPEKLKAFIDVSVAPFRKLCDYGDKKNINIILENHGGASSHPAAMEKLMAEVDHPRFGTLPDFGNFPRKDNGEYALDIYDAIDRLMKFAKAVSAKCYDFDEATGLETKLDFERLIKICVDKHKYSGFIGIEYEGDRMSEFDGVKAAKKLLDKLKKG